jgi:hypothetical protein
MFITPLLEVAQFLAEAGTFARDICKPKSPVKGVFLPTTQKLGLLQFHGKGFRANGALPFESLWDD